MAVPGTVEAMIDRTNLPDDAIASLDAYGRAAAGIRDAHADSHAHLLGPVMPVDRETLEAHQDTLLAPGATRATGAGNRPVEEAPDPYRTCFSRDLDRIKHTTAFRRLAGKCQVFLAPEDDHLRTRLTHAVEVAQVAVSIARACGLNVELTEAIALGHDCGHGPAGHASEEAFAPYRPDGIHDHAVWGADTVLAPLNLCQETTDGIRNHSWKRPAPATPEGEVVSWADRIAYVCHDADDACRSGILTKTDLPAEVLAASPTDQSAQLRYFIGAMIDTTVATGRIGMHEDAARVLDAYRAFNYERIYLRPASRNQAMKVIGLLRGLVDFYADNPRRMPAELAVVEDPAEAAVTYVAGMTDRFALAAGVEHLGIPLSAMPAVV